MASFMVAHLAQRWPDTGHPPPPGRVVVDMYVIDATTADAAISSLDTYLGSPADATYMTVPVTPKLLR